MGRIQIIREHFFNRLSFRTILAVVLGNVILGAGCAGLRLSMMGNDPYTACTIALSTGFHVGLGNFQLGINVLLLLIQLVWGCRYLGLGSIVNMCFLGYLVQFFSWALVRTVGSGSGHGLPYCLVYMLISLVVLSFGLAMYQTADLGVSPYDYLAIGLTDRFPRPYFLHRVMTDGICVLIIVAAVFLGLIGWGESDLGIGTILTAFCLGPLVSLFSGLHRKWIPTQKQ